MNRISEESQIYDLKSIWRSLHLTQHPSIYLSRLEAPQILHPGFIIIILFFLIILKYYNDTIRLLSVKSWRLLGYYNIFKIDNIFLPTLRAQSHDLLLYNNVEMNGYLLFIILMSQCRTLLILIGLHNSLINKEVIIISLLIKDYLSFGVITNRKITKYLMYERNTHT
jgi:hypothetical protein